MKLWPKPLSPGSRVAVIAPSGGASEQILDESIARVSDMGFVPIEGRSCRGSTPERGYLAAESDAIKVGDIHAYFSDSSIDGIICLKGGSGAGRLIRFLDGDLIAKNPKVFAGYSDITILHSFIALHCSFVTFHGPVAASSNLEDDDATRKFFLRMLTAPESPHILINSDTARLSAISPGSCRGELTGGNLSMLCTTIGTAAEIDTRGRIVLIEDIGEEPYRVDRMLNHLINAGKLSDSVGILLGDFTDCNPPENYSARTVDVVARDVLAPLGIPILWGRCFGHGKTNITLPLGAVMEMDADHEFIRFL
ncbi:MAG: LD-carboxypeptidase [Synergistaceae bacterium]|jgi:muramoyltetrapeptide carboxypeptidase|nr:LD-carboxypeptidase [Synergistaceae bacterium]